MAPQVLKSYLLAGKIYFLKQVERNRPDNQSWLANQFV